MTTRTYNVESPVEISISGDSTFPSEHVLREAMRRSPERVVFIGESADDPESKAEFIASIEALMNKPA
ncbi:hypothetical protein QO021_30385 (plasmid) [Pseudomonas amygdali pv. lachrymans]|uniref:hypothetical protein n=1 Tax=Pseudomonas amygdali TaxID=47877 RepID=UPI0006B956A5|nr:hypothetical protein [Pseudomonas amygdali]KPC02018.1 Unknown protein sequence [Pseudomonas amygdali pv. lachrymans]RMM39064.1 hypothetical protein ALQ79_200700 [Pseudomonas amygdali pv. lachrymans]WIO61397.1 hypothetical protein QO021_30385 [Pseudomonas amygdali pv. lachrymans]